MSEDEAPGVIRVRVAKAAQLFNTLDPTPFRERHLDSAAEDYIVELAEELPKHVPIRLLVTLTEDAERRPDDVRGALAYFFQYRCDAAARELKEFFRTARRGQVAGLAVLGACLAIGQMLSAKFGEGHVPRFVEEGLIILGWVANWRPFELFLYDWWPLAKKRTLYRRLANASIEVTGGATSAKQA